MTITTGTRLGRYEVRSHIGKGGMGEVYIAQDTQLRRSVALKLLPSDFSNNEDRLRRFEQEAYAASALNHPNVAHIYEISEATGFNFIAMEYIEGETLRQRIKCGKFELQEALDIVLQAASALGAAHQVGVVHRDIKPENIMLRPDGYVKVLDFGLAKLTEYQCSGSDFEAETMKMVKTEPGLVMGTVSYMSPEQARGLEVDARSDIWSLGVVLYEMVTGKRPFDGLSTSDVISLILKAEPLPIIRLLPKAPTELQWIIKKALRKEREERYQTIKEMVLDLKNLRREIETGAKVDQSTQPAVNSIAILPFKNLTNDAAVSFYEFSLADVVITELVRLRSLIVRPSSVVAKYLGQQKDPLEVGQELGVKTVLAASFLHTGERIRVTAQLLDVINGDVLWGDRIDSNASDIITVQDIIVQRIIDGLQLNLNTDERIDLSSRATANAAAYEEYLRGRDRTGRYNYHTLSNEDVEAAVGHFQRAIKLDPKFALAYCGLGNCYIKRFIRNPSDFSDVTHAQDAFDKGLAMDPGILEARVNMVYIYLARGEKHKARIHLAELRGEAPNTAEVHFCSVYLYRLDGEYEKALHSSERLAILDPAESLIAAYSRARIFIYQGRYADAMLELDKGAAIAPNHPYIKSYRAVVYFRRGHPAAAANLLHEVLADHPELYLFRPFLAMCLSALGEHEAARAQFTEEVKEVAAHDPDVPYWLASAYVMENEHDEAFKWLERAISLGNENRPWFESNPVWEPLRDDPRFKKLMSQIALTSM